MTTEDTPELNQNNDAAVDADDSPSKQPDVADAKDNQLSGKANDAAADAGDTSPEQPDAADTEPAPAHIFGPMPSRLYASTLVRLKPVGNGNIVILGSRQGSLAQMVRYEAPWIRMVHSDPAVLRAYKNHPWFSFETLQAFERAGKHREVKRALIGRASPYFIEICQASPTATGLESARFGLAILEQAQDMDLVAVLAEAKRLLQPGGRIVLMGYMPFRVEPKDSADRDSADRINRVIAQFIKDDLKPFYTTAERHLSTGFRNVDPSLQEVHGIPPHPDYDMVARWNRDEVLKHMLAWPAVAHMHDSGEIFGFGPVRELLKEVWGSKGTRRQIRWPVISLSGTVHHTA